MSKILDTVSVSRCHGYCADTEGCAAFVFYPVESTCILKDSNYGAISRTSDLAVNGAVAGIMDCDGGFSDGIKGK